MSEVKVKVTPAGLAYAYAGATGNKLGSRITAKQVQAVQSVKDHGLKETATLKAYAQGDGSPTEQEAITLRETVGKAQAKLTTPSQKRRLWPRKVAAIIITQ